MKKPVDHGVAMTQMARRPSERRKPLLKKKPSACAHCGEIAGGTTAECAAVCCCCPCGLVDLLVLAVVRLPAALCRRVLRKNKKRRVVGKKKVTVLLERKREDTRLSQVHPSLPNSVAAPGARVDQILEMEALPKTEASPVDDEEWVKLYTGFWRDPSEGEVETSDDGEETQARCNLIRSEHPTGLNSACHPQD